MIACVKEVINHKSWAWNLQSRQLQRCFMSTISTKARFSQPFTRARFIFSSRQTCIFNTNNTRDYKMASETMKATYLCLQVPERYIQGPNRLVMSTFLCEAFCWLHLPQGYHSHQKFLGQHGSKQHHKLAIYGNQQHH